MPQYKIETDTSIADDLAEKAPIVHTHVVGDLTITGTPDSTKFLRGDGQWAVPPVPDSEGVVGVTDHGSLTGLDDDDHPHYLTNARGDARYIQESEASTLGKSVLGAADAQAARDLIGAGTSNLQLGTTGLTAKPGNYVPTKADVGLGAVDNTSDLNKPVSTAQAAADAAKGDKASLTATVIHNGTASGGTRPTGYARVLWVIPTGANYGRPTNMVAGDLLESDA